MRLSFPITLLCACVLFANAAPESDEVTSLPGWPGELPSKIYSGFVSAGVDTQDGVTYNMHEQYFFVESENDPKNDPVIVWTNGGPGASSYFGLFVELGPFQVNSDSLKTEAYNKTGIPTLFYNEYTWTKLGNVLILNSPPPVGYSYCDPIGQSGNGTSCGSWNDTRTAVHNAEFINNFAKEFPEYAGNDWYIVGESYAGVYVPTLVRELLGKKEKNQLSINLQGFAIGDGCMGTDVLCGANGPGPFYTIEFFRGHGQFSEKLYSEIQSTCSRKELIGYGEKIGKACEAVLQNMNDAIGGYYAYNLYDDCWYQNSLEPPHQDLDRSPSHLGGALNDYPCGGPAALFSWIRHPAVKKALHVASDAYFFSGDNGVGFTYDLTEKNLLPFMKHVTENTDLRVLIYNGDTDPSINSFLTQNWTSSLNFPVEQEWRPWTLDGKSYMGGYVTRYKGDFDFLTIRGSGHMVPEFKPKVTLSFLKSWIEKEDWKRYVKQPNKFVESKPFWKKYN